MSRRTRLLALVALLAAALPCRAGIEEGFGISGRGIALGNAYTSLVRDTSAPYYNPAAIAGFPYWSRETLGDSVGLDLDLGLLYAKPELEVTVGGVKEPSAGTPTALGGVYGIALDLERATGLPDTALGVLIYLPYETIFEYESRNITNPAWVRYFDDYNHLSLYPGLAFSPSRYFSLGLGLRFSLEIEAQSEASYWSEGDPDKTTLENAHIEMGEEINVGGRFAYLAGLTVRPLEELKLAVVYRQGIAVHDWGTSAIHEVPFVGSYEYDHLLSHYVHPTQYELGASWEAERWLAALTVSYNQWDGFTDTYTGRPVPDFENTWTVRAGGGIRVDRSSEVLVGYTYEPTPVPAQTMVSNFLDCDRHIVSLGSTTWLDTLFDFASPRVGLTLYFQMQILPERRHRKDVAAIEAYYADRLAQVQVAVKERDGTITGYEPLSEREQEQLTERYTARVYGTTPGEDGALPEFVYAGLFYSLGASFSFRF